MDSSCDVSFGRFASSGTSRASRATWRTRFGVIVFSAGLFMPRRLYRNPTHGSSRAPVSNAVAQKEKPTDCGPWASFVFQADGCLGGGAGRLIIAPADGLHDHAVTDGLR